MWTEYLQDRTTRGELAASSAEVIGIVLRAWHRHAGPIPEWAPDVAARWVNDQRLRPSTRKGRLGKLRPYCRWLIRHGHLTHDITIDIAAIQVPVGSPRDLTPEDVRAILRVCPDARAVLIVLLMVHCGLRCGDVARIRLEDIDTRRQLLHVRAKGGRGEPTHWEPIPTEAWEALVAYIRRLGRSAGPLVDSYQRPGLALTPHWVSHLVGQWIRDAGIKGFAWDGTSAHSLRHTMAQQMIDGGADLREVQFALGHRTTRSTEIYLRREPPGLREAMEGRRYAA